MRILKRHLLKSTILILRTFSLSFALAVSSAHASLTCTQVFSSDAGIQLVSSNTATRALDPRLVKGVVELADKEEISQEIYDEHLVNDIARAVIRRIRNQEIQFSEGLKVDEHKRLSVFNETDIILFFWDTDLTSIEEKGFLSQHLSGKSHGRFDNEYRREGEDNVTGIKLGSGPQALRLRPKSALQNIRPETDLAIKSMKITTQYGNIGAVLKAEVKERSTWTSSDSLALGKGYLGDIDYSGKSLVPYRGTFYRESLPCQSACFEYYEAMVYGDIGISDVDYFLVETANLAASLVPYGRPIYIANRVNRNKRIIFEKGQMLFEGSDAKPPSPMRKAS